MKDAAEESVDALEGQRPAFARTFPHDPALDAIVDAFARGDYARVRKAATALAARTSDDEIRRAARELRARTEADPLARALLAITLVLLVVLSAWWVLHDGASG